VGARLFRECRSDAEEFKTVLIRSKKSWQQCFGIVRESFWLNSCLKPAPSVLRGALQYPKRAEEKRSKPSTGDVEPWSLPPLTRRGFLRNGKSSTPPPLPAIIHPIWDPRIFICSSSKEFLGGKRHSNDDEVKQTTEKSAEGVDGRGLRHGRMNAGAGPPTTKMRVELESAIMMLKNSLLHSRHVL